jgi:hypothetical protein
MNRNLSRDKKLLEKKLKKIEVKIIFLEMVKEDLGSRIFSLVRREMDRRISDDV